MDIGVLSDGYASAATQDAFCADTTCTITEIYNQSSDNNHLTPAPPGQAANVHDLPASASALPIIAGGHKVYGVYISSGVGYRNDSPVGTAMNGAPEGVYMVSSAAPSYGGCCFDFGNAEITNTDLGHGYMDAINLSTDSSGTPIVGLDMEDGIPGAFPVAPGAQFLTAMGWNNGSTNYELYGGNAQSGGLTSTGSRQLPPEYYQNMHQQGAIILGIGGDNSNWATGNFFEGVMTAGAPSDSSMNQVQANIVSVGYKGAPVTLRDGGTYTFENQASQMFLDNSCDGCSGAPTSGFQVIQYSGNGNAPQQWTLHSQGNGYFTMVSVQSGLCLDDPYGNGTPSRTLPQQPNNSTMLWQVPCNGKTPQNWKFIPQSNGYFVIVNQGATASNGGTQMAIDDLSGQATQGLQMWLYPANGLPPQNWLASLPPGASGPPSGTISDGATYTLENQASRMFLDNSCDGCSGAPTNGFQVIQYSVNGYAPQQWTLHSQGNGYFTMVSVQSGLCLDDPYGNGNPSRALPQSQGNSTMLWQIPCNGQAPQNWKFVPQSNGYFVLVNQGATASRGGAPMVLDDYNGQATLALQMWLADINGQPPQNWRLDIQH